MTPDFALGAVLFSRYLSSAALKAPGPLKPIVSVEASPGKVPCVFGWSFAYSRLTNCQQSFRTAAAALPRRAGTAEHFPRGVDPSHSPVTAAASKERRAIERRHRVERRAGKELSQTLPLDQIRSRMLQPNNVAIAEGEDIPELGDMPDLEGEMTAPGEVVGSSKRPLDAGPADSAPRKRGRPDG